MYVGVLAACAATKWLGEAFRNAEYYELIDDDHINAPPQQQQQHGASCCDGGADAAVGGKEQGGGNSIGFFWPEKMAPISA